MSSLAHNQKSSKLAPPLRTKVSAAVAASELETQQCIVCRRKGVNYGNDWLWWGRTMRAAGKLKPIDSRLVGATYGPTRGVLCRTWFTAKPAGESLYQHSNSHPLRRMAA